jgi:hypothetical protein
LILPSFSRVLAQDAAAGPSSIVTVEPKNGNEAAEPVPASAVKVKVDGKDTPVAGWTPYGANATQPNLQLVLLIDDSARSSLGLHIQELQKFIKNQPATTETAVAYMRNGTAQFSGQFTTDHDKTAQTLRLPIAAAGSNGSPYFALSDLIKKWPAHSADERREVIMITDGIDRYNGLRYDPSNPYIDATIRDTIRNRVIVYAIYYHSAGFADRTTEGVNSGQNYLTQLCDTAGGYFFYQGLGNPVDFGPFLQQINRKLANQYELRVTAPEKKQGIVNLKVQVSAPNTRTKAPDKIFLGQ